MRKRGVLEKDTAENKKLSLDTQAMALLEISRQREVIWLRGQEVEVPHVTMIPYYGTIQFRKDKPLS